MLYFALKVIISAMLIAGISELSRRSTLAGAVLASVPLVSVLAMVWLFIDTRDNAKVAELSKSVFWLVLPSLVLFLMLPVLLKLGWHFAWALLASCGATVVAYFGMLRLLAWRGIAL